MNKGARKLYADVSLHTRNGTHWARSYVIDFDEYWWRLKATKERPGRQALAKLPAGATRDDAASAIRKERSALRQVPTNSLESA